MFRSSRKLSISSHIVRPISLIESLNKTYTLYKSEKYDEFLDALGVDKSTKINAMLLKPSIVLSQDRDEYELTHSYSDGQAHKVRFRLDEQFVRSTPGGSKAVSKFELKSNKLKEKLMFGDNEITILREFRDKILVVTMAVNRVKCIRHYRLTPSKHSIQTETSRRQSLFKTNIRPSETSPQNSESTLDQSYCTSTTKSNEEMCF